METTATVFVLSFVCIIGAVFAAGIAYGYWMGSQRTTKEIIEEVLQDMKDGKI